MSGLNETVRFRVEIDEFRCEEVVGCNGMEDEARVELLGLARKAVVGEMLDESAVRATVESLKSSLNLATVGAQILNVER